MFKKFSFSSKVEPEPDLQTQTGQNVPGSHRLRFNTGYEEKANKFYDFKEGKSLKPFKPTHLLCSVQFFSYIIYFEKPLLCLKTSKFQRTKNIDFVLLFLLRQFFTFFLHYNLQI